MVNIEVRKVENVTLSKDFIDLRSNIKYKDPKITNNIKQNRLLRKQTRRIETIQNLKQRFKKGVQLVGVSLFIIGVVSHNFNFKFDIANASNIDIEETILNSALEEQEVEKEMDAIIDEVLKPEENIKDYKEEFQEDIKQIELEKKKQIQKQEIKKVEKVTVLENRTVEKKELLPEEVKTSNVDLDRLAFAVSMAETSGFTKGYGVSHLNGQGIKHGNTVPCPGVEKMKMCKFKTQKESNEAFKVIWGKWYKTMPNMQMAERWTGKDSARDWLNIVNYYYYNDSFDKI